MEVSKEKTASMYIVVNVICIRVAEDKGFHPTKEHNKWYSMNYKDITKYKVWIYIIHNILE